MKHEQIITDKHLPVRIILHNDFTPASTPPHWHRAIEINAMLNWPLSRIGVGGVVFEAETGRIWLANSMSPHYNQCLVNIGQRKAVSIQYPLDYVQQLYPKIDAGSFFLNKQESFSQQQWQVYKEQLFPKMDQLYNVYGQYSPMRWIRSQVLVLEILDIMLSNFYSQDTPIKEVVLSDEMIDRIRQIIDYVDSYYNSDIKLDDIAKLLHLSRGYTAQLVKENLGLTLGEYVSFIRCKKARKDLLNPKLTQTEIAQRHGFSGLRSMNRQLVQHFGLTAKEFRKYGNSAY